MNKRLTKFKSSHDKKKLSVISMENPKLTSYLIVKDFSPVTENKARMFAFTTYISLTNMIVYIENPK